MMDTPKMFSVIYNELPEAIAAISSEGIIISMNKKAGEFLDLDPAKLERIKLSDLLLREDAEFFDNYLCSIHNKPEKRDFSISSNFKTGKSGFRLAELNLKPVNLDDSIIYIIHFSSQIPAEHINSYCSFERCDHFKKIYNVLLEGVQVVDKDLRYLYVNNALLKQVGMRRKELIGFTMPECYPGVEKTKIFETLQKSISDGKSRTYENKFIFPDGSVGWYKLGIQPLWDVLFIFSKDITEEKRSEEMLTERNEELSWHQKELLKQQSMLLSSQINPHFIFNALNSLQYYILNAQTEQALNFTSNFSQLMRKVLNNSLNLHIPLCEELEFLEKYLQLEQKRHQDNFDYSITISKELDPSEVSIPPMLLQPYIENSVVHGIGKLEGKGLVGIHFEKAGNNIKCTISDNGVGREKSLEQKRNKSTKKHKSLGMGITRKRLEILKNLDKSNYKVSIEDLYDSANTPNGTRVNVNFPLICKNAAIPK